MAVSTECSMHVIFNNHIQDQKNFNRIQEQRLARQSKDVARILALLEDLVEKKVERSVKNISPASTMQELDELGKLGQTLVSCTYCCVLVLVDPISKNADTCSIFAD